MKEITKEDMALLFKEKVLIATDKGVVNQKGFPVSYTTSKHKRFIMDEYVDIAHNLARGIYGKEKIKN